MSAELVHSPTFPPFSLPTPAQPVILEFIPGQPLFILGQNGTGKSALVHRISNTLPRQLVSYVPGSRPNYFDNESIVLAPVSARQMTDNFANWDATPEARWRPINGTARNEVSVFNLKANEVQYKLDAANDIADKGAQAPAIGKLQSRSSPLDQLNRILRQGNLPVQLQMARAELVVQRFGQEYSIARMSDGERAALIIAAEVISAPIGKIFIIDEPEPHLHESIAAPLLAALIRQRPDCAFVISTHELSLPEDIADSRVLMVRGCTWHGNDVANWDVDLLPLTAEIPEDLRVEVLGSRRKILFVEGVKASLDQPMYALLFPNVSVQPRDGSREVRRAVTGLRSVPSLHRVQAYGLVDNDGLSVGEIASLEADGVHALPVFSVESLYYSQPVRAAIATQQAATFGLDHAQMLTQAEQAALDELRQPPCADHLAARVSLVTMREQILAAAPNKKDLMKASANINISIASPYPGERQKLQTMLDVADLDGVIRRYPVR